MWREVSKEMRGFAENTSVKGIGRTMRTKSRVVRSCWIAFLFVCLGLLLFQVVSVLMNYYSYVVIRNTAVIQTSPNFPDVTICNLFPVTDRRDFDARYGDYLRKLDLLRHLAPEEFQVKDGFWYFLRSLIVYNVNSVNPRLEAAEDTAINGGFVVECRENRWDLYNGVDCRLHPTADRPLQQCVHIRPTNSDAALIKAMLFIDDFWHNEIDSFYSWTRMAMSSGVRVMIHPAGIKPDSKTSIFIAPGTDFIINVKQTNVTRLSSHSDNCTKGQPVRMEKNEIVGYSQPTCVSLCRQQQTNDACSCIDTFEFFTETQLSALNGTFCLNITEFLDRMSSMSTNETDRTLLDALWTILKCYWNYVPVEEECDCPAQCVEVSYDYTVSSSRWPSAIYQMSFYERYLKGNPTYADKFTAYDSLRQQNQVNRNELMRQVRNLRLIEDNFLQVTVKMNERSVTKVTDIFAMSWDTMASNLGGCLNLWLGISVLTAAEVIELFYSLIRIILRNNRTDDLNGEAAKTVDNGTLKIKGLACT